MIEEAGTTKEQLEQDLQTSRSHFPKRSEFVRITDGATDSMECVFESGSCKMYHPIVDDGTPPTVID